MSPSAGVPFPTLAVAPDVKHPSHQGVVTVLGTHPLAFSELFALLSLTLAQTSFWRETPVSTT
jgi:hypothetical protein